MEELESFRSVSTATVLTISGNCFYYLFLRIIK